MQVSLMFLPFLALLTAMSLGYEFKHHNYLDMYNLMKNVNEKCNKITRLYNLPNGDKDKEPLYDVPDKTFGGKNLWVIEFAKTPGRHVKGIPEFKYVANMHGNEVSGRELTLRLIDYLCDKYYTDDAEGDRVRWLVDETRIHLMPSMNPDGWQTAFENDNGKDWVVGRNNSRNVDLNRNFPRLNEEMYRIENKAIHRNNHLERLVKLLEEYGDKLENEVKMVMVWLGSIPFVGSANMHNGDLVANYPYDSSRSGKSQEYTSCPDDATFKELALSYSSVHPLMGRKKCEMPGEKEPEPFKDGITNGAAWYSVEGGMQDYNYLETNCFEITLEQGCEKFPPEEQLEQEWEDNKESLLVFMEQVHIGVKGFVSNIPQGWHTVIKVYDISAIGDENENGYIDHDIIPTPYGDYFRLLADGDYRIQAVTFNPNNTKEMKDLNACISVRNEEYKPQIKDFDFNEDDRAEGCFEDQDDRSYYYGNTYDDTPEQEEIYLQKLLKKLLGNY